MFPMVTHVASRLLLLTTGVLLSCSSSPEGSADSRGQGGSGNAVSSPDASTDSAAVVEHMRPDSPCTKGALCDGKGSLCSPTPLCTAEAPCEKALSGVSLVTLSTPLKVPVCRGTRASMTFDDGPPRLWNDSVNGQARAACVFRPPGTNKQTTRPLVLLFHGAGGGSDELYSTTSIRAKAAAFNLSGDPARPGFILAMEQGLAMQAIDNGNPPATRREIYYRDFSVPSTNADYRNADRLIDELVAEGGVDPRRIYLMGWSNGAFFSTQYGLARHVTPTPGGNKVAAIAVFDGGDPFAAPRTDLPGCKSQYPRVPLPVFSIHRACSIVACNAGQNVALDEPPGFDVLSFISTLRSVVGARDVTDVIVDGMGIERTTCQASCTRAAATIAHTRWPDGIADGSGTDYEPRMLDYLRAHPL